MADEKAEVVKVDASDERIPAAFKALVRSGAILATEDQVKVEVKGKTEKATRGYVRLEATSIEGALALTSGRMTKVAEGENKGNGVLDHFNYGYDLGVRSDVRNKLLTTLEGPEKAIERGVKGLMASIPGITADQARAIVIEQRKLRGEATE